MKTLFILLSIFIVMGCKSQTCISVDCKDSVTLPFASITLTASSSGPTVKTPIWNVYSIPVGALKPVIANPLSLGTSVSGFTNPGIYVFTFSTGNIVLYDTVITKMPTPIPVPVPCPACPPIVICPKPDTASIIKWYLALHPCPPIPIPVPCPPIPKQRTVVGMAWDPVNKNWLITYDDKTNSSL